MTSILSLIAVTLCLPCFNWAEISVLLAVHLAIIAQFCFWWCMFLNNVKCYKATKKKKKSQYAYGPFHVCNQMFETCLKMCLNEVEKEDRYHMYCWKNW